MSDFRQLVPEHVRRLGGYTPGKSPRQAQQESGVTCIKLASNETPFGPSSRAIRAMQNILEECNYYPDNDAREVRDKLAQRHGVRPEQVVVTAGSTALLGIISRTLLAPGLNAVTSKLSFIVYPIATRAAGGDLIEVPTKNDGFDLDAIAGAINSNTRIVFLANPNNPTGTLIPANELDRFLKQVPEHVITVLDEAYFDFAQYLAAERGIEYSHWLEYVQQERRAIVLRTFSKAHGLAGVRIGYGMGPAELMSYFARMRTTFSVSAVAQAGALGALEDDAHTARALENNAREAARLLQGLSDLGYRPVSTWANFIYCEIGEDAGAFARRMQAEGVIIRPLGPWGAPAAIRVTIGTPDQNQTFLKAFKKAIEKVPAR